LGEGAAHKPFATSWDRVSRTGSRLAAGQRALRKAIACLSHRLAKSYAAGVSIPASKAKPILVADGWRKRSGDIYTRPLAPGVLGLLGLGANRGMPHQWRLQPYVGVIHERVNALARMLTGSEYKSPYPEFTIRCWLVTLLEGPGAQERDRWLIASEALDGNERVFREVADAARDVGLPWIQKRTSIPAVVYELRDRNGPGRRTPYLTAALWMQGEVAAAEAWLAQIESQFAGPPLEIPKPLRGLRVNSFGSSSPPPEGWPRDHFDAFARRLREGMAQYPDGPPEGWRPQPK
jgi:hypothetical protein